jgi:hypothetical protein
MDPFTLALATFGVQKLRGKSTKRALRDAALVGGGSYLVGASGALGPQSTFGQGPAFSTLGFGGQSAAAQQAAGLPQMKAADIAGAQFRTQAAQQAGYNRGLVGAQKITSGLTKEPEGIAKLFDYAKKNKLETALLAASAAPLLMGDEEEEDPPFTEEDYRKAYEEQSDKLEGAFVPATDTRPTMDETIRSDLFYANQGGLATAIPKFNKGGINYLPSKSDHDENDYNNYVRAEGYVEDGAGNGDKDKDTMLAQLADGEFVSRADAVLGAGILSGGDPKSYKSMRKAGADFFYGQQKQFKRIYDLVNENKSSSVQ